MAAGAVLLFTDLGKIRREFWEVLEGYHLYAMPETGETVSIGSRDLGREEGY